MNVFEDSINQKGLKKDEKVEEIFQATAFSLMKNPNLGKIKHFAFNDDYLKDYQATLACNGGKKDVFDLTGFGDLFYEFHQKFDNFKDKPINEENFLMNIFIHSYGNVGSLNEQDFTSFLFQKNINIDFLYWYFYRYHIHVMNDMYYKKENSSTMKEVMSMCQNLFSFFKESKREHSIPEAKKQINHLKKSNLHKECKIIEFINKNRGPVLSTSELAFVCKMNCLQINMLKENLSLIKPIKRIQVSIVKTIWQNFVDKFKFEEAILSPNKYSKLENMFPEHKDKLFLDLEPLLKTEIESYSFNSSPVGITNEYFVATIKQYMMLSRESQIFYFYFVFLHLSLQLLFRNYIETTHLSKKLYILMYTAFKLSASPTVKTEILKKHNEAFNILNQKHNQYCLLLSELLDFNQPIESENYINSSKQYLVVHLKLQHRLCIDQINEECKLMINEQIDSLNKSLKANKYEKNLINNFWIENLKRSNFHNIKEGIEYQINSLSTFTQKMNGIYEKVFIEKPLSSLLNINVFDIKSHTSNAHTIKVVINQLKRAYFIKQRYHDYKDESRIPFSDQNTIIKTDFTKDFQYFKKVLLLSDGTLSYSTIMKARRVCLIFCGLYSVLYNKIEKPSNLIQYLYRFKKEAFQIQLKQISVVSSKFVEFEQSLKSLIGSFVEVSENELENLIIPKYNTLLDMVINEKDNIYTAFSSGSMIETKPYMPRWVNKEIKAFISNLKTTIGMNLSEFIGELLEGLKKKIAVRSILSDLETNKSSEVNYFKMLNSKFSEYDDNLADLLRRSCNMIFDVQKI